MNESAPKNTLVKVPIRKNTLTKVEKQGDVNMPSRMPPKLVPRKTVSKNSDTNGNEIVKNNVENGNKEMNTSNITKSNNGTNGNINNNSLSDQNISPPTKNNVNLVKISVPRKSTESKENPSPNKNPGIKRPVRSDNVRMIKTETSIKQPTKRPSILQNGELNETMKTGVKNEEQKVSGQFTPRITEASSNNMAPREVKVPNKRVGMLKQAPSLQHINVNDENTATFSDDLKILFITNNNNNSTTEDTSYDLSHDEIVEETVEDKKQQRFRKRKNLSMEFFSTEKTYVSNLESIINNYKAPMSKSKLFEANDIKVIFLNTETLIPIHKKLLSDFEQRLNKDWGEQSKIGDIVKTLIPFMKLYIDYVNGFDKAKECFSALINKSDKQKLFIEACDKISNNGISEFYSLQICPIQRVPRYVLLLKELKDCTDESHDDYKDICDSFNSVSELASTINRTKQKYEDEGRLRKIAVKLKGNLGSLHDSFILEKNVEHKWASTSNKISKKCFYCTEMIGVTTLYKCNVCGIKVHEHCYKFCPSSCSTDKGVVESEPTLIDPTRKFIKKARMLHKFVDMEKLGESINQKPKECVIYLMNDSLLIAHKKDKQLEVLDLVKWKSRSKNAEIKINEIVAKDSFAFSISNPRIPLSHTFFPTNLEEKNEWLSLIKSQVQKNMEESNSRLLLIKNDEFTKEHLIGMKFSIPGPVPVGSSSEKHFTAYMIDMTNETGSCTILKRYRGFLVLHQSLKKIYNEKQLPHMPGKKLVGNMNDTNISKRCRKLEDYLNGCMCLPGFLDTPVVHEFLTTTVGAKGEEKAILKVHKKKEDKVETTKSRNSTNPTPTNRGSNNTTPTNRGSNTSSNRGSNNGENIINDGDDKNGDNGDSKHLRSATKFLQTESKRRGTHSSMPNISAPPEQQGVSEDK